MPFLFRIAPNKMLQVADQQFIFTSPVTISGITPGTGSLTDISSGTSVTNGVTYNVYSFQPPNLAPSSTTSQYTYTVNYSCTTSTQIYVLAVGGGGGGSGTVGGGGGGGGVVMNPVTLPAGASSITVAVGAGGIAGNCNTGGNAYVTLPSPGSNTTVSFAANVSSNIIAWGGGQSGSFYTSTAGYNGYTGSSGGGASQSGTTAGSFINSNNNYGCAGTAPGYGGGGGGAGTPAYLNSGGNGIQCFLPGIGTFAPSGTSYNTYYWGGGGGGCQNGSPVPIGGLGGGGGGSNVSCPVPYSAGGGSALNTGVNGKNNSANSYTSPGGGNGGANTGGGGGGGWWALGGSGGSGIVVIAFPSSSSIVYNGLAVLPSTIYSSGLYNALLNNASLSASASNSINCSFACRLINYNYFGPIMTLRYSTDTNAQFTKNFYADICGNIGTQYLGTGQSLSSWLTTNAANTTYAYVTKWYDQGMDISFNCATQYTLASQPIYDVSYGVINFGYQGVGGGVSAPATQCYLNLPNGAFPYGDSSFSYITKIWNTSGTSFNLFMGAGGVTGSNNNAMYFDIRSNNTVNTYVGQINLNGAANASNNVVALTYNNAGGTSSRVFFLYSYNNGSETQLATGNPTSVMTQYNTYNFLGGGNWSSGGIQSGAGLNGQMYYFYAFSTALGTTDRSVIQTTQSQFIPLPPIVLNISSITSTSFIASWSAVANATTYVMYINGAVYGTVTSGQTITTLYNGPWGITVNAYNASYNLLASGYFYTYINIISMTNLIGYYPVDTNYYNYALATPSQDGTNFNSTYVSTNNFSRTGTGSAYINNAGAAIAASVGTLTVTFPASPTTVTGQFSTCAWFYVSPSFAISSTNTCFINLGAGSAGVITGSYFQLFTFAPNLATYISIAGTNTSISPTLPLSSGVWFHLGFSIQYNSPSSTTINVYYNGINVATIPATSYMPSGTTYYPTYGGANQVYLGYVDDIRIYNRVLTANEWAILASMRN